MPARIPLLAVAVATFAGSAQALGDRRSTRRQRRQFHGHLAGRPHNSAALGEYCGVDRGAGARGAERAGSRSRPPANQTTIDTTIVAREADKGAGLAALRDWVLGPAAETIGEADLAMFKAATRSFAPANIGSRNAAQLLGCEIVSEP
jgi:hypothetical protein